MGPPDVFPAVPQGPDGLARVEYDRMKKFLYQNKTVWQDVIEYLPEMKESWHFFTFLETAFKGSPRTTIPRLIGGVTR